MCGQVFIGCEKCFMSASTIKDEGSAISFVTNPGWVCPSMSALKGGDGLHSYLQIRTGDRFHVLVVNRSINHFHVVQVHIPLQRDHVKEPIETSVTLIEFDVRIPAPEVVFTYEHPCILLWCVRIYRTNQNNRWHFAPPDRSGHHRSPLTRPVP